MAKPRSCIGYVRVNPLSTDFGYGDILAVVGPNIDGIVLPKVESADRVQAVSEAIAELEHSDLIRETFGEHLFEQYLAGRRQEWNEYRLSVSQWELERYLPIY